MNRDVADELTDDELDTRIRDAFAAVMPLLDGPDVTPGSTRSSGSTTPATGSRSAFHVDNSPQRRRLSSLIAVAAAVLAVVGGLAVLQRDVAIAPVPPADGPTPTPSNDLGGDDLVDPATTVFGALIEPHLPAGYELVLASDGPEPLIVALTPGGDRFEAIVHSSAQRVAEADRVRDELEIEVPEGLLAVGADDAPDERSAYLVTDNAVIRTEFVRVADESTIEPGIAVGIARAIARELPPALASGQPVAIGTEFFNESIAAVEALATRVVDSGGTIRSSNAPTVEVTGDFGPAASPERATVRVEMFAGFTAPRFLIDEAASGSALPGREVVRAGRWLLIVTVEGAVSNESAAYGAIDAIAAIAPSTSSSGDRPPTSAAPTATAAPTTASPATGELTLLLLDPPPDGYALDRASYRPTVGGGGVAVYTSPDSSTELTLVLRNGPLPAETLTSLGRTTWEVDGRTVWSDGELDNCLPDHCSIGTQWDDGTSLSLAWSDPRSGDLVAGSTQLALIDLLADVVESEVGWQVVDDAQAEGSDTDDPTAPADAVPIVSGDVVVANANVVGGSAGRLSALLGGAGFRVGEPVNSANVNRAETTVYVAPAAGCLGFQVASAIGITNIESMPDVLPADGSLETRPDVFVDLGNDVADRLGDDGFDVDLGPAGRLVVVDGTDDTSVVDSLVAELTASGVAVTDVLQADREVVGNTFNPIGQNTPWTCGAASAVGIDGFDTWMPDIIDGDLPVGTDAVLVIGT